MWVIEEFSPGYEVDYTLKEASLGNTIIGKDIVKEAITNIKNFPRRNCIKN